MSTTSLHGVNHFMISANKFNRFLWILIILGCLAGLIVNIEKVVSRFQSTPISIEMNYNLDMEEYPSITFCPSTIYSTYLADKRLSPKQGSSFYRIISNGIEPLWSHLYEWQRNMSNGAGQGQSFLDSHSQYMKESSIRNSLMQYLLHLKMVKITRQNAFDFIFSCEFTYQKCSFLKFKMFLHPVYKFCFTFQMSEKNNRLGYPEYLSLIVLGNDLNINLFRNSSSISLFRGGLYEVTPFRTMPTMKNAHPFTSQSRQIVSITKTEDQIVNSELYPCHEKRDELITLLEQDIDFNDVPQEFEYRYSAELCEQILIQSAVYQYCNCVSTMLPLSKEQGRQFGQPRKCAQLPLEIFAQEFKIIRFENLTHVSLRNKNGSFSLPDFVALFNGGSQFLTDFQCHSRMLSNRTVRLEAIKQCLVPCRRIEYSLAINQNSVPYDYDPDTMEILLKEHILYCEKVGAPVTVPEYFVKRDIIEGYRLFQYLSGFHLYFQTSEIKVILQTEGYTLVNLLSDFGGVLGLWFGMSVATLMEFVELGTRLLFI